MNRRFGPVVFLSLFGLLLVAGRSGFFHDPGTFWHIRVGERILAGELPRADWLSYTFAGRPWIAHQWLAEAAMAWVDRQFGLDGFVPLIAGLLAALHAWLAVRAVRRGLHPALAAVLAISVLAVVVEHVHARPATLTQLFLVITIVLIVDVEAARRSPRWLLGLVPLSWMWANCHGGVVAGAASLWFVVLGWTLRRRSELLMFGWIAAALVTASALVTPYGMESAQVWLRILRSPVVAASVEHRPPVLSDPATLIALGLLAVYLVAVASSRPVRITSLVPLGWAMLAAGRVRNLSLFALVTMVLLPEVSAGVAWLSREGRRALLRLEPRQVCLPPWLPVACIVGCLLAARFGVHWARLDPKRWPVGLGLAELEPARIYHDLRFGGYLAWVRRPLFVDDRFELYGDAFLAEVTEAEQGHPGPHLAVWQERWGRFDYALVTKNSPLDQYFASNNGWLPYREDLSARLYRHRD